MDQALKEMDNDGLNSLKYSAEVTEYPLFTLIRANLENALWTLITSRIYKWRVCSPGSDVERTRIKSGFLLLTLWSEQRLEKIAAHNFLWEGMRKKWPVAFSRRPFSWVPASLRFIKSSLFLPDIWKATAYESSDHLIALATWRQFNYTPSSRYSRRH